jgi:Transglutaminase-like superfamily
MTEAATARVRLALFAALAAFTSAHWVALVEDPPVGRTVIAVLCAVAGAAALALIASRVRTRVRAWPLAAIAAVGIFAAVALALGLPARLLVPSGWGELLGDIGDGLGSLGNADYPYAGGDPWSRLVLLVALGPLLALAAALVFWPGREGGKWRLRLALVVLVAAYGLSVTLSAPNLPALRGLILFALIAAWIWVPGLDRRGRRVAVGLLAVAGLAAVPFAARLDAAGPWLDYSNWDWGSTPLDKTESFDWNHTYGPLDWSRDGRSLLVVGSKAPHYWSTEILNDFDGYHWAASPNGPTVDLPLRPGGGRARLNREWLVEARFEVHALSSQLLPGTGTVLSVVGLHGAERTPAGVSMPTAIGNRDAYTVRAYDPDPSPSQMRASEGRYPSALSGYTTIGIPSVSRVSAPAVDERGGEPKAVTIRSLAVPLRGTPGSAPVAADLGRSAYGRVYRLARGLAAGQSTAYGVATATQRYLRSHYRYSETPPKRAYPLAAFLFRDRVGYCQQFSGAMALMLRMVGIPTRVVGGFAPGRRTSGGFQVSDFDAHSWVEVYFNRIGWVTFDPTPPAAPAISRSGGLFTRGPRQRTREIAGGSNPVRTPIPIGRAGQHGGGSKPLWPLFGLAAAILIAVPVVLLWRIRRWRPGSGAELAEAQAIELQDAVGRLRTPLAAGTTLRALERRLRGNGGPRAAAYAARLRECRYDAGPAPPPSAGDRRAARRALSAGLGLRGRLQGWLAMPPGGPAPPRQG